MGDSTLDQARRLLQSYRRRFEDLAGSDVRGIMTVTAAPCRSSHWPTDREREELAAAPAESIRSILELVLGRSRSLQLSPKYLTGTIDSHDYFLEDLACCDLFDFIPMPLHRRNYDTYGLDPLVTDLQYDLI
jgi:hypothetical protein